MEEEHKSIVEWATSNYDVRSSPEQELEFVLNPKEDKIYPGEERDKRFGAKRRRRRQVAKDVWREVRGRLPIEEVLRSFKSMLGDINMVALGEKVQGLLQGEESDSNKDSKLRA
eukprot:3883068-Rhodomonas_salina.1